MSNDDDWYTCGVCDKRFYDEDTHWKVPCEKCGKDACVKHRVELTGDYDDMCVCVWCASGCVLCEQQPVEFRSLEFCDNCRIAVCDSHSITTGYCKSVCLSAKCKKVLGDAWKDHIEHAERKLKPICL